MGRGIFGFGTTVFGSEKEVVNVVAVVEVVVRPESK